MTSGLLPHANDFAHRSKMHGQDHVARVMVHAFRLIAATHRPAEASRLWAAVYLHDLSRTHDGECHRHGADAVRRLHATRALRTHLEAGGVQSSDWSAIELAVTVHCMPSEHEPQAAHPYWPLVALLKDANALDRVRFGPVDPAGFHLPESAGMLDFAQALYEESHTLVPDGIDVFDRVLEHARRLSGEPIPVPPAVTRAVR
jgi:hypothetical protein